MELSGCRIYPFAAALAFIKNVISKIKDYLIISVL